MKIQTEITKMCSTLAAIAKSGSIEPEKPKKETFSTN